MTRLLWAQSLFKIYITLLKIASTSRNQRKGSICRSALTLDTEISCYINVWLAVCSVHPVYSYDVAWPGVASHRLLRNERHHVDFPVLLIHHWSRLHTSEHSGIRWNSPAGYLTTFNWVIDSDSLVYYLLLVDYLINWLKDGGRELLL